MEDFQTNQFFGTLSSLPPFFGTLSENWNYQIFVCLTIIFPVKFNIGKVFFFPDPPSPFLEKCPKNKFD